MSNSVDPDETAHYETSHLDLLCLQTPIIIPCGSETVKLTMKYRFYPAEQSTLFRLFLFCFIFVFCLPSVLHRGNKLAKLYHDL